MPPLRDRRDDIPLLVEHFLDKHRFDAKSRPAQISEDAMAVLMQYNWPGNVRDLENTIERAVVLSRGGVITPQHLSFVPNIGAPQIDVAQRVASGVSLKTITEEAERMAIEEALRLSGYDRTRAAERLGISRRQLDGKIRDYNILVNGSGALSGEEAEEEEQAPV